MPRQGSMVSTEQQSQCTIPRRRSIEQLSTKRFRVETPLLQWHHAASSAWFLSTVLCSGEHGTMRGTRPPPLVDSRPSPVSSRRRVAAKRIRCGVFGDRLVGCDASGTERHLSPRPQPTWRTCGRPSTNTVGHRLYPHLVLTGALKHGAFPDFSEGGTFRLGRSRRTETHGFYANLKHVLARC